MEQLLKNNIIAIDLPDWLSKKFYFEWGVIVNKCTYDNFFTRATKDLSKQHVLIFEHQLQDIFKDKEKWHSFIEHLEQSQVRSMIFYIRDLFYVEPALLRDLNKLGNSREFHVLSNCYHMEEYENLTFHVLNEEEDLRTHPTVQSFALEFARNKKHPKKDFLLMTVLSDDFRKAVHKRLIESGTLRNSIVQANPSRTEVYSPYSQLIEDLRKLTRNEHFTSSVIWMAGNGPPNFKFYEEVFCEIVLESRNSGISDISEKTFRPVLLGVPIVFLGSKVMHDKLIQDGYKLVDNDEFYEKWHSDSNLDDRLDALVEFVEDIKTNEMLKKEMSNSAEHNFKVFWTQRPLINRKNNLNIIHECFGDNNLVSQIYKRFNI